MNNDLPAHMRPERSFQGLILALQRYWADWGCVVLQPYDMEVGAGTFHPATTLRALGPKSWNAAYVQPSRRPADVAVILDADVIVVRRLTALIDAARSGRLVAFINNEPNEDRFFPEWRSALTLGPLTVGSPAPALRFRNPRATGLGLRARRQSAV